MGNRSDHIRIPMHDCISLKSSGYISRVSPRVYFIRVYSMFLKSHYYLWIIADVYKRQPVQGLTATADAKGNVKGYAEVSDVMLPPNPQGKLDVGGAVGLGILNVIKDMGLKEPYAGQVALQTGEIAEDLTYYFATSEQIPSAVGLGAVSYTHLDVYKRQVLIR